MKANTMISASVPVLVLALTLAGLPGAALADPDDDGYQRVHGYERHHEHHHWYPGPPRHARKRVEHHHYYYYDRPYYRDDYVRRDYYYYPRYRNNEFTIIYRGGW